MAHSWKTQRVSLTAGSSRAVYPPCSARAVRIGNAGADDLKVYSTDADEATYFIVAAGYEKEVDLKQYRFDPFTIAFYLKEAVDATAVLIWI